METDSEEDNEKTEEGNNIGVESPAECENIAFFPSQKALESITGKVHLHYKNEIFTKEK